MFIHIRFSNCSIRYKFNVLFNKLRTKRFCNYRKLCLLKNYCISAEKKNKIVDFRLCYEAFFPHFDPDMDLINYYIPCKRLCAVK